MIRNVRNFTITVKCRDANTSTIRVQRRIKGDAITNPRAPLGWCWFTEVIARVSAYNFWGYNVAVIATDSLSLINCIMNMKKSAIPPVSSEVVGDESVVGSGPPSLLHLKQNFYILGLNKRNLTGQSHNSKFARKYHPPYSRALYHDIHCPSSHKWAGPLQLKRKVDCLFPYK